MHLPPSQTTTPPPSSQAAHTELYSSSIASQGPSCCAPPRLSGPSIDASGSCPSFTAFLCSIPPFFAAEGALWTRPGALWSAIAQCALSHRPSSSRLVGGPVLDISKKDLDHDIAISPFHLCSSEPGTRGGRGTGCPGRLILSKTRQAGLAGEGHGRQVGRRGRFLGSDHGQRKRRGHLSRIRHACRPHHVPAEEAWSPADVCLLSSSPVKPHHGSVLFPVLPIHHALLERNSKGFEPGVVVPFRFECIFSLPTIRVLVSIHLPRT